jgi:phosphate transport system permease protein
MALTQRSQIHNFIDASRRQRQLKNKIACTLLGFSSLVVIAPLVSIFLYVVLKGVGGLNLSFFTDNPVPVGETGGGMAGSLIGTGILLILSTLLGVPLGLFVGIFLSESGPSSRLARTARLCIDLLAGIPSIIVGLFVYSIVVVPMHGFSAFAGAVALSIIIIPTVARTTEELLALVQTNIREGGLALGIPRWKVTLRIVVKGSVKGITTGIILALARAAGETAPLLFTAFNNRFFSVSLTDPISSVPVQIFTYAISPFEEWQQQAWTGALVLVSLIFLINALTRWLLKKPSLRPAPRKKTSPPSLEVS